MSGGGQKGFFCFLVCLGLTSFFLVFLTGTEELFGKSLKCHFLETFSSENLLNDVDMLRSGTRLGHEGVWKQTNGIGIKVRGGIKPVLDSNLRTSPSYTWHKAKKVNGDILKKNDKEFKIFKDELTLKKQAAWEQR